MKIIFLDIDGVLCTHRAHYAQGCPAPNGIMHALDREAVGLMNVLALCVPGAEVRFVLISTWRLEQHPVGKGGKAQVEQHLREFGWQGQFHDDWKTIALDGASEKVRGIEIADWMARHPEVDGYVIIDDGVHFAGEQKERHVQPAYAEGLAWRDFKRAAQVLHGIDNLKP